MLLSPAVLLFELRNNGFLTKVDGNFQVRGTAKKYATDRNGNRMELGIEPCELDPSKFHLLLSCKSDRPLVAGVLVKVRGDGQGGAGSPEQRCVMKEFADDRISPLTFVAHKAKKYVFPTSLLQVHDGMLRIELVLQHVPSARDEPYRPMNHFRRNMLKLFESGDLADGWFKCTDIMMKERIFPVHNAILFANDEFLDRFIPRSSTFEDPLVINRASPDVFEILLRWMYGCELDQLVPGVGEIRLALTKGKEIIVAANYFGLGSLKMAVEAVLVRNLALDGTNSISYLEFSDRWSCFSLKEMAMNYVVARVEELWDKLPIELHKEVAMEMATVIASGRKFDERPGINSLRRELGKRGLDPDGSPQSLQSRLNESNRKRAKVIE